MVIGDIRAFEIDVCFLYIIKMEILLNTRNVKHSNLYIHEKTMR